MDSVTRWLIAIVGIVFGIGFASVPFVMPDAKPIAKLVMWGFAAFCGLMSVACLSERARPLAGRLIAATIFAASLGYIYSEIGRPLPEQYRRSEPNLINAIFFFIVFGLPAAYVMFTGKFPKWSVLGNSLHGSQSQDKDDPKNKRRSR